MKLIKISIEKNSNLGERTANRREENNNFVVWHSIHDEIENLLGQDHWEMTFTEISLALARKIEELEEEHQREMYV